MDKQTSLTPFAIEEIFSRFKALNPEPRTELVYTNAFTLVVAVALSAQATDISVNKATAKLFEAADSPAAMLALGEDVLKEHIKTIGLFNTKAKNVMALCRMLVNDYGGEVPQTRDALMRLPGVGRKTANVVLNEAFGYSTIAVDTHIYRVSNRLNLAKGKTPDIVEQGLEAVVPDGYKKHAHHWLLLHGRYTCKARVPDCPNCRIKDLCPFEPKTIDPAKPDRITRKNL